jgi:cell division protease FtsH
MPELIDREEILKVHVRVIPLSVDVNLKNIARSTAGFTGADLANVVNEAALLAAQRNKRMVTQQELDEAVFRVLEAKMISKSPLLLKRLRSDHAISRAARYTAGQIIVTRRLGLFNNDASIVIGSAVSNLLLDSVPPAATKAEVENLITVALGGRAAELAATSADDVTLIGEEDLRYATMLAERSVRSWGFGALLSVRSLTSEVAQDRHSAETLRRVERDTSDLLARCLDRAGALIKEDTKGLTVLIAALAEHRFIYGSMITRILTEGIRDVPSDKASSDSPALPKQHWRRS